MRDLLQIAILGLIFAATLLTLELARQVRDGKEVACREKWELAHTGGKIVDPELKAAMKYNSLEEWMKVCLQKSLR